MSPFVYPIASIIRDIIPQSMLRKHAEDVDSAR
jgi:hypothetical protein